MQRIFDFILDRKFVKKDEFYFFDYFGNFERFEYYDYDKKLKAPKQTSGTQPNGDTSVENETVTLNIPDETVMLVGAKVGDDGMRIDREFNKGTSLREAMLADEELREAVEKKNWDKVVRIVNERYNNKQQYGYENNESIGKQMRLQRIPSWRELVELYYGIKTRLKTKEELLQAAVTKCMQFFDIEEVKRKDIRKLVEAYVESKEIRNYISNEQYMLFDYTGIYTMQDFIRLGDKKKLIAQSLKDIVPQELLRSA